MHLPNRLIEKRLIRNLLAPIAFFMLIAACNDAGFSGNNGKKAKQSLPAKPSPKASTQLSVPCVEGRSQLVKKLSGTDDPVVSIEGEFCGSAKLSDGAPLTVLFIIDGSGSMRTSDPTGSGSCGRLKATEQILNTLKSAAGSQIKIAIHFFGDLSQSVTEPTSMDSIDQYLNPATLCRFDRGGTNYESAMIRAQDTLQNIDGKKVVYFITDGEPSTSGTTLATLNSPSIRTQADVQRILTPIYRDGLNAADKLRAIDQVSLYALYLKVSSSPFGNSQIAMPEDPEAYLKKIAGDPERFRLATSAEELAEKIAEFDTPSPLELEPSTLVATLVTSGFDKKTIKINSLTPTEKPGVWKFVSEPFPLNTRSGEVVLNSISITVKSSDGQTLETIAKIDYLKEK